MKRWQFSVRKEKKLYAKVTKIYSKNESSVCEIVKEKEIRASWLRDHFHIAFIPACYILLIIGVNFLLFLTCKLNFIIDTYIEKTQYR